MSRLHQFLLTSDTMNQKRIRCLKRNLQRVGKNDKCPMDELWREVLQKLQDVFSGIFYYNGLLIVQHDFI